jgi:hypothetical protein
MHFIVTVIMLNNSVLFYYLHACSSILSFGRKANKFIIIIIINPDSITEISNKVAALFFLGVASLNSLLILHIITIKSS